MLKKLKMAIQKFKANILTFFILYLIFAIFVMPSIIYTTYLQRELQQTIIESIDRFTSVFPFKGMYNMLSLFKETNGLKYIFNCYQVYSTIYFIAMFVLVYKSIEIKPEFKNIEHGSSDWANEKEIYSLYSKTEGLRLAEGIKLPINTGMGNKNVLIVGNTGSGKSSGFVLPNVIENLGSYIFTDPKGEIYDYSAEYFRKNGYEVKVLNLTKPNCSDGYNPIVNIKNDIDLDVVVHTIVMGQDNNVTSEAYWTDNAKTLLRSIIRFLKAARPKEEQNLASCSNMVRMASGNGGFSVLSELMRALPPEHMARKDYQSIELAPEKAFGSICSTLQAVLSKFDNPDIANLTSTNTINFKEIGQKKTAVYVISPDTHSTYDFLLTIFFAQMMQQLYECADENGGALDVPVFFFLDEFANIGKIPDFERKVATARSRKIFFNIILQSLEQLEDIYEGAYETIIGNCGTHLFLGSTSTKTLEYFSKALGEKTITAKTKSKGKDSESENEQILGRSLMTPDEIRRMPYKQCLIIGSGIKPIKTNKYFYHLHKESMISDSLKTNHNEYFVNRGEWKAFSIEKKNEEKKFNTVKDFFKKIQENSQNKVDEKKNEEIKSIENKEIILDDEKDKTVIDKNIQNNQFKENTKLEENKKENIQKLESIFDTTNDDNIFKEKENKEIVQEEKQYENSEIRDKVDIEINIKNIRENSYNKKQDSSDEMSENELTKKDYDLEKELEKKFDLLFGKIQNSEREIN